jgi:hypothetical protein
MNNFLIKHKKTVLFSIINFFFVWIGTKFLDKYYVQLLDIKYTYYLYKILSIHISIFAIIFGVIASLIIWKIYFYITYHKNNLKIYKAVYGNNDRWIDITQELNQAISKNKLNIVLSNKIAGDPIHGIQKIGKVKYSYDDMISVREYIEGDSVVLPLIPH